MKTKEKILEGNKLIAEFLGLKRGWWIHQEKPLTEDKKQWCDMDGNTFLGSRVYFDKDLEFNKSWDWLMPVIEKIELLGADFSIKQNKVVLHGFVQKKIEIYRWDSDTTHSKIENTFEGVVEFIKWYNKIKYY